MVSKAINLGKNDYFYLSNTIVSQTFFERLMFLYKIIGRVCRKKFFVLFQKVISLFVATIEITYQLILSRCFPSGLATMATTP